MKNTLVLTLTLVILLLSFNIAHTQESDGIAVEGSIKVIKSAQPSDGTDFDFTLTRPDNSTVKVTLDDDNGTNPTRTDNFTVGQLSAGDYDIAEVLPNGWTLDSVDCGNAGTSDIAGGVRVSLAAGEDVICTFSNVGVDEAPTRRGVFLPLISR